MSSMNGGMGMGMPTGRNIREKVPTGYRAGAIKQFNPQQIELFNQAFSHVSPDSYLSKLAMGDESQFEQMEAPALRQFSGIQGNIASRFSGAGGLGGRRSSGFQNEMGQQASNFSQQLQSQRQSLRSQAIQDLMGMSNQLLGQRPYQRTLTPARQQGDSESGGWGGLLGAGIGGAGGFFAGGPAGALSGAQLGYGIGSSF